VTSGRIDVLRQVLEQGVGTDVVVDIHSSGARTGIRSHFAGLTLNQGPICIVTPSGLQRHRVAVHFGKFSSECIAQMQRATSERKVVAQALVADVAATHEVVMQPAQSLDSWEINGPDFALEVTVRKVISPASEEALVQTAKTVMVPLMAAMAELIGYDEAMEETPEVEGDIVQATILRRERSRRSRLLCLSIHGNQCAACGLKPSDRYGDAGNIIEVHHLEPVSMLSAPRPYDPREDLVPLCPNCHRAVHTRRPVPYTVEELRGRLSRELH